MRALPALLLVAMAASHAHAGEWPQFHADPLHSGLGPSADFQPPKERWWSQSTGGPIEGSPVVSDGRVFVGSTDGKLYAFDAVSGSRLWAFDAGGPLSGTPALSGGVLYLVTNAGRLHAIDATTGKQRLSAGQGSPDPGPSLTSPSLHQGRLYIGTEAGTVIAYNLQTLTKDWEYSIASERHATDVVRDAGGNVTAAACKDRFAAKPIRSSPAVYLDRVYFGSDVHTLFAVDEFGLGGSEAGKTRGAWGGSPLSGCPPALPATALPAVPHFPQLGDVIRAAPAIDAKHRLVIVASYDNTVRAYGASDGALRWSFTVAWDGRDSRVISTPAAADGKAYFGSFNGRVYAVETAPSAPGGVRELWNFTAGDAVWSSPAVSNGLVAFGADDETVYVLDAATGQERWRARIGGDVRSSPAIANGVLYVAGADGIVYAFGGDKPPLPDLLVEGIAYGADPPPLGQDAEVAVVVRNGGNLSSPATELQLYVDGALAATRPVPPLEPGANHTVNYTWRVAAGNHSLHAVADAAGLSREFNRANNELRAETAVAAAPPPPPPPPPPAPPAPAEPPAPQEAAKPKKKSPGPGVLLLAGGAALALALRRRRPA